ncbi:MAG TPA: family 16 glycoside hydrolase [Planctomycetota bacterium]|nr:family 16 glycoside hydrolase [Planctomycetota bacterium]
MKCGTIAAAACCASLLACHGPEPPPSAADAETSVTAPERAPTPEPDAPPPVLPAAPPVHSARLAASLHITAAERASQWESGLWLRVFQVDGPLSELIDLMPAQTPNVSRVVTSLDLGEERGDFGLESNYLSFLSGALFAPEDGTYAMRLTSDDGSTLALDGRQILDHGGLHAPAPKEETVELACGWHAIELRHFESGGGALLRLEWRKPSSAQFELVPESALATRTGIVRLTAPGEKRAIRALVRGAPGDGRDVEGVHPSYRVTSARPEHFEPRVGGLDWLPDGRMLVCTWDAVGAVWALTGTAGDDRSKITVKRLAAGLAEPLGLRVLENRIFVLQKQELTELVDHDGDEVADEYRCVCSGWDVSPNFHEFAFGLVEKDGFFYANLAVAILPGGASAPEQVPGRGSTLRIDPRDGTFEIVAHGLRTPNGIGLGPEAEIFLTDNQGDWLPSSKLLHLEPGAFYGSRAVLHDEAAGLAVTPPVLWLPQDEIGNSPSEPALLPEGHGPYSGQLVFGDVTHGGVQRAALERVDGVWQGAVFRFTQGLEAGVNRLRVGPDRALYAGGIGTTGNWGQAGKKTFGLERLSYTGESTFELLAVRARANGFELEFTEPLEAGLGGDPTAYALEQWWYQPTPQYGGPKMDLQRLHVSSASVSADRRRVFLAVDGCQEGHVVHVRLAGPFYDERGRSPWSTEAWYTLNRIPIAPRGDVSAPLPRQLAGLDAAQVASGWRLLFDGVSLAGWRGYKLEGPPAGWRAEGGVLERGDGGGDLATVEEFGDFELELEWQIAPGGNSGVMFHVSEDHGAPYETGPEMQILDNQGHPDGKNPLTSAGANYALDAPPFDATYPPGQWNRARLVVSGPHVEHWLNGHRQCSYELWTSEWQAKVAASKFAKMPAYGKNSTGHIVLQDHGDQVRFRNVRVRVPPR